MPRPKTQAEPAPPAQTGWLPLGGVLLTTLIAYASTFTFGWVYDDPPQIPQNPNLEWGRLGFLFSHQLWASTVVMQARFYRPLLTFWFLINKTVFGLNPHCFHITTVLAHVAATTLAYYVARAVLKDSTAAVFAAAIFALHPLQVESASWISAVNDPLAAAFCFSSFLLCRRARQVKEKSAIWWALAAALFLLALFTKEVSIVLPGIVLVDLGAESSAKSGSPSCKRFPVVAFSAFAFVAVPWLLLRSWVLGDVAAVSAPVPGSSIFLSAPKILLFNLYRAIYPVGLSPQYDLRPIESLNAQFLLTLTALAVLAALAISAARRDSRLWVALAWIILPMLPTLNLAWMNEDDFIHDRYLYMSMLGIALLAGATYSWMKKKWPQQQLIRPLAACLVIVLGFASAVQSQFWANDLILFSRSASRAPENEWAQLNYGSALSSRGKFPDAAPHFVRSYELKPGWRAADFAGFAYQHSGDLSQAEQWFNTALKFDPSLAAAWFGLGQIRLAQHLPDEAIPDLKKAVELEPSADGFHYELGSALEATSQTSAAAEEYKKELDLHPYQTGAQKALDRLQSPTSTPK